MLVIDTETTGIGPRWAPPHITEAWDGCRIVQIAWELHSDAGVSAECHIVVPDGFEVPAAATAVHGISHQQALDEGRPMRDVLARLATVLESTDVIVAHNLRFDDAVIQAEMYRFVASGDLPQGALAAWQGAQRVCTMLTAAGRGGRWTKLAVLYEQYFGAPPGGTMHSADADVRACAEIFFHQRDQLGLAQTAPLMVSCAGIAPTTPRKSHDNAVLDCAVQDVGAADSP